MLPFVLALTVFLTAIPQTKVQASEAPVTFSRQIAPILYKNCSGCHHTGGSGPFPLTTYAEAKRWASTIETVTQSRYMPPWLPELGHGDFAGNRRMSADEIALLKQWAESSTPEGDPAEAPPSPVYKSDWQLGPPDLILEVDSPMQVPASGTDLFRNFILPYPLKQSKWVRAMEIKPGSPRVVHHANLILDRAETLRRTHPHDWQQGIPGMDVVVDAGEGFDPDGHFLDWKPDSSALVEPSGMAWRLDPGNDLVLNTHLKPTGKPETIRARIGLYFTPDAPTKLPILVQLEHDAALDIPAGNPNFLVEDELTLPVAVDVLAIYPHAHYLGKRLEGWATLPDGSRKDLILIPNWDIDRQSIYRYATPVSLPAGSTIHMRYSYDNSAANPHNPNSPPIRVTSGNRSVDEMGHLWLQLLPHPAPGEKEDPREPILRAWMQNVLEKSPTDPTALFNLASVDMSEAKSPSDYAEAVTLYQRALKSRPNDARMCTAYAAALLQSGNESAARAQLQAAIAADPTYPDAPYNLALIEAAANQLPEAIAHLKTTLTLESANPSSLNMDARHGLVALYAASNQLPEAIREQKTITTLAPNSSQEWNDLGALLARSGDTPAATEAFHRALTLDPTNSAATANLNRLQSDK